MKKLTAIDTQIVSLDGNELPANVKLPTLRNLIRIILNNQVPKNSEDSLDTNQILLKLRIDDPDVVLENSEFKLIKDKVNENQAKMFQSGHGQLVAYLTSCEKAGEKESEKK